MIRTTSLRLAIALLAGVSALPPLALAASGGAPLLSPQIAGPVQPQTLTVTGDGITLTTRGGAILHRVLWLTGTLTRGRNVVIERNYGTGWVPVANASAAPDGSFTAAWRPDRLGTVTLRATLARGPAAAPPLFVPVYRPAVATMYGPGLFGHHTACGALLSRQTLGVANRTMRCGTRVALYYRGRTIVVPVIDRGPYANGANWDLTQATAGALRLSGIATVGAMPVSH